VLDFRLLASKTRNSLSHTTIISTCFKLILKSFYVFAYILKAIIWPALTENKLTYTNFPKAYNFILSMQDCPKPIGSSPISINFID
jgi:hypothetical protein